MTVGRGVRPLLAAAVGLALAGCSGAPSDEPARPPSGVSGPVVVFAAASLTEVFERLGADFTAAHPDIRLTFNFGASSALAQSVRSGAPADVFAAASPATMAVLTDAGDATGPAVFARNRLEIAVPAGNPGKVTGLPDLARPELKIALCAPQVPCGSAAETVLAAAGLEAAPDTLEQDVKAALSKVRLGEVDAALVYRTDVLTAGEQVEGIAFPEAERAVNDYLVVPLDAAPHPTAARAFVAYVLSREGRQALADAGFQPA